MKTSLQLGNIHGNTTTIIDTFKKTKKTVPAHGWKREANSDLLQQVH